MATYPIPKGGEDLSTYHGLSRQVRGVTGRPGRVPVLRSQHYLGFDAAPAQNIESGGQPAKAPEAPPQPAAQPAVFGGASDTGESSGGFEVGKGVQGLLDLSGQMIGNEMAKGLIGRGAKGLTEIGTQAAVLGVPAKQAVSPMIQGSMASMMAPFSTVKGVLDAALVASPAAEDIAAEIESSGLIGENTDLGTPMGTAASNAQVAALSSAPTTLGSLAINAMKGGPSASETGAQAAETAEQGLSESVGLTTGSEDPVAKALFSEIDEQNPKSPVLKNMLEQQAKAEPIAPQVPQTFTPMSLSFTDPHGADVSPEAGFEPMTIGPPSAYSPSPENFTPMSINMEAAAAESGQGAPSGGTSPGGSVGPPGTPGQAGMDAGAGAGAK